FGGVNASPALAVNVGADEVQSLTLGGTQGGTITPTFNSAPGLPLSRVDEAQTLTVGGAENGTIQLSFNDGTTNGIGSAATQLVIQAGVSPTQEQVLAHLQTISALSGLTAADVTG